ncbi:MAG: SEL1-like repeat protein [Acidiferrobacterales bacterium]
MRRLIAIIVLGLCVNLSIGGFASAAEPELPNDILRDAHAGNSEAQLEMGILYEYGFRMQGNRVVALAWYQLAADQGNERAEKYRNRLSSKLSTEQKKAARKHGVSLSGGSK